MKQQTPERIAEEMRGYSASEGEIEAALEMFRVLRPALKIKKSNGRIETTGGDKTALGLYRTLKDIINSEAPRCGYEMSNGDCNIPNKSGLQEKNCLKCETGTAQNLAAIRNTRP